MEILCLNVRGLANPAELLEHCNKFEQLRKSTDFCLVFQETKIMRLRESHEKIMLRFKYKYEKVPAVKCSEGLISVVPEHLEHVLTGKSNSSQSVTIKKECSEISH